jgi:hypothetical protein
LVCGAPPLCWQIFRIAYKNIGDGGLGFESLHAHVMATRSVARAVLNTGVPYPLFGESNDCVIGSELLCGSAVSVVNAERKNVFELTHKLDKHVGAWSMKHRGRDRGWFGHCVCARQGQRRV